ncbi:MFS transporter [Streptomyces sp. PG2]
MALLAASSAPTPLYPLYQDQWGLSALAVTVVFSAYSLALLSALLTTGALSDRLGRRPVLAGALGAQAVAMVLLASAGRRGFPGSGPPPARSGHRRGHQRRRRGSPRPGRTRDTPAGPP